MKLATTLYHLARRGSRSHQILWTKPHLLQYRCFQPDFVPRDPKAKPIKYKYPAVYEPYGPRPPPSEKILHLAEKIVSLSQEERMQIGPTLHIKVSHPKLEAVAVEGMTMGAQVGGSPKAEEKKTEKTTFDVKLEKFDAGAKLKVIKEIRSFTDLGLKEAKELVEKAPVVLKQQVSKDEATSIIEKIKAVGGVAVME